MNKKVTLGERKIPKEGREEEGEWRSGEEEEEPPQCMYSCGGNDNMEASSQGKTETWRARALTFSSQISILFNLFSAEWL